MNFIEFECPENYIFDYPEDWIYGGWIIDLTMEGDDA
jgi:hypothetical protein